jgi:hypothetical protein
VQSAESSALFNECNPCFTPALSIFLVGRGAGRSRAAGIDRLSRGHLSRFVEAFAEAS